MTPDPNKKTPRTFQCRDALWYKFEQMARELECSVDYLINDAMKQYARQRGYTSTAAASLPAAASHPATPPGAPAVPAGAVSPPLPGSSTQRSSLPPPPRQTHSSVSGLAPLPPPPTSPSASGPIGTRRPGVPPPPPPPPMGGGHVGSVVSSLPSGASARVPPPPLPPPPPPAVGRPGGPPPMPRPVQAPVGASLPGPAQASLAIYYGGERFTVNKDRFIIGRGKQSSDLTIKDPNVSRQHAMVEFLNGQYFIVDMGSTNGVEFAGQRVQRKAIAEGDIFKVCDHELRFSFS